MGPGARLASPSWRVVARHLASHGAVVNRTRKWCPPVAWAMQTRAYAPIQLPSFGGGLDKLKSMVGLGGGGANPLDQIDLSKAYTIEQHAKTLSHIASMANMASMLPASLNLKMSAEQTKQAQDKINQMTRIIAVMTPEDKTDPAKLSAAARGRVAAAAGVPVAEVNACISEYQSIKARVDILRERKASGQKMPENFMELEQQMATAQGNRTQGNARFTGQSAVRVTQQPVAVEAAGKNAKCGCGSGKKFKRCCMK